MSTAIEHRQISAHAAPPVFVHSRPAIRLLPDKTLPEQRASELVCDRVRHALDECGYRALLTVEVQVHEGLVRLIGTVSRYYFKQRATAVVLPLDGVEQLRNELKVNSESQRQSALP